MNDWDPANYGRYADERSRPYDELVRRIGARSPAPGGRSGLRNR